MLERPTVNLGFSGQGRMDLPIAEILAELKPAAYVIDCTANMTPEEIGEKMVSFIRILRRTPAEIPIVVVENYAHEKARWLYSLAKQHDARHERLRVALRELRKSDHNFY